VEDTNPMLAQRSIGKVPFSFFALLVGSLGLFDTNSQLQDVETAVLVYVLLTDMFTNEAWTDYVNRVADSVRQSHVMLAQDLKVEMARILKFEKS